MPDIRVGADHVSPPYEYLTAQLAWDALSGSDQGGDVVLQCLGDCGTAFTPTGTPVNNWSMRTQGVDYNFTTATRSQLAILYRPKLAAVIDIRHMLISSNNAFENSITLNAGSEGSIYEYLSINHPNPVGVDCITVNPTVAGSILRYSDLNGGVNGIDYSFNRKLEVYNLIVFNATDDGLESSGSNSPVTDVFAFNNGVNDFSALPTTTSASEDGTGNFTGYTSAELVDFAGGDYRTKASSDLASLGTGGLFIGVALESTTSTYKTYWTTNFSGVI